MNVLTLLTGVAPGQIPPISGGGVVGLPSKTFVFNANGTYTPTPGIVSAVVECYGGGGGGAASLGATGVGGGAGGGGSGGYSRSVLLAATIGASKAVTIGAGGAGGVAGVSGPATGGTTSFGALVTALGGGGAQPFNSGAGMWGEGGNGAGFGVGDFVMAGQPGENASVLGIAAGGNFAVIGGTGGALLGGGGQTNAPVASGQSQAGIAAVANTGAGGAGGAAYGNGLQANGGAGGSGVCIVTEFS